MRVLVIEDHEDLAGVLARGLRRDGMAVDVALDGPRAGSSWVRLTMTSWCWTGTCRCCMVMRYAAGCVRGERGPGC
jgi:hypothetical protein